MFISFFNELIFSRTMSLSFIAGLMKHLFKASIGHSIPPGLNFLVTVVVVPYVVAFKVAVGVIADVAFVVVIGVVVVVDIIAFVFMVEDMVVVVVVGVVVGLVGFAACICIAVVIHKSKIMIFMIFLNNTCILSKSSN